MFRNKSTTLSEKWMITSTNSKCLLANFACYFVVCWFFQNQLFKNTIRVSNSLDPDLARLLIWPDLGPDCLQNLSADDNSRQRVNSQPAFTEVQDSSLTWSIVICPWVRHFLCIAYYSLPMIQLCFASMGSMSHDVCLFLKKNHLPLNSLHAG